jgi:hypothetical protein
MRWLRIERPLLGNARNIHVCNSRDVAWLQQWKWCFLCGSCRDVISMIIWSNEWDELVTVVSSSVVGWESSVAFRLSVEGQAVKRRLGGWFEMAASLGPSQLTRILHGRDIRRTVTTWAREAEECPLLKAVARERLLKTQQDVKRLSGCCGDLWIVKISSGAVITCSSEWCVHVVSKPNIQSIPRL